MAVTVNILINGVRVAKASKYGYEYTQKNDVEDTFDGPEGTPADYGTWKITLSRLVSYVADFETKLAAALQPDNEVPIVIQDKNITDTYTGCMVDSIKGSKAPNKALTEDFSFSTLGTRSRKVS